MEEKNESRRVRMTKRILKDAMIDLMEEKNINRISIKEICELADVNRSTFYAHYENQYDLLEEIEKEIVDEIPRINLYYDHSIYEQLLSCFRYIEHNRKECAVLFKNTNAGSFEARILDKIFGKSDDKPQRITGMDIHNPVHVKMLMSAFGGLALAEQWIFGEINCSADELAKAVSECILKS